MKTYKLKLSNGRTSKVRAISPLKAKYKYYGSASHFNSEASVISVNEVKGQIRRRPTVRRSAFGGFRL
jgi:hypothetical protein